VNEALVELAGTMGFDGDTSEQIGRMFDQVEIAQDAIEKGMREHPERAASIDALFVAMRSPIIGTGKTSTQLFKVHCRQLIAYMVEGIDIDRPTMIEVAVMVCKSSLTAPIKSDLSSMVLGDEGVAEAFGFDEHYPTHPNVGEHYWDDLRRVCIKAYRASAHEMERSKVYLKSLKKRRDRRWEQ
jgi:hypothetical protein